MRALGHRAVRRAPKTLDFPGAPRPENRGFQRLWNSRY